MVPASSGMAVQLVRPTSSAARRSSSAAAGGVTLQMLQSTVKTATPVGRASSAATSASGPSRGTADSLTMPPRSGPSPPPLEDAEDYARTLPARWPACASTARSGTASRRRSQDQQRPVVLMGVGLGVVEPAASLGEVPEPDPLAGRQGDRDAPGAVAALAQHVDAGRPVVEVADDGHRPLAGVVEDEGDGDAGGGLLATDHAH